MLSCTTQGQMQSSAVQPILHHQEETKRVVTTGLTREIIEDLIESISYYDQILILWFDLCTRVRLSGKLIVTTLPDNAEVVIFLSFNLYIR